MNTKTVASIGFYSPEQYERLLKTADDRNTLHDKWIDWLDGFTSLKTRLDKEFIVVPFPVDVDEMTNYFTSNNLKNIGKNRAAYISRKGEEYYNRIIGEK